MIKFLLKKKPAKIDAREFESISKQNQFKKFKIRNFTVESLQKYSLKKKISSKVNFIL